jgi:hypothetical protein
MAAFECRGHSAAESALGLHLVSSATGLEGRSYNPAAGSFSTARVCGGSYTRSFGLAELDEIRVEILHPADSWLLGGHATRLGGDLYSEQQATLTLSRRFGKTLAAGVSVRGLSVYVEGYDDNRAVSCDLGLLYRHRLFDAGVSITDAASTRLGTFGRNAVQRRIIASVMLPLESSFRMFFETLHQNETRPSVSFGFEIKPGERVTLRAGYESAGDRIHIGLALTMGGWSAGTGFNHHPRLGWSRTAGLTHGVSHATVE